MVQAVTRAMGCDGEPQMKLRPLPLRSPPAVRPGSVPNNQPVARGLGAPAVAGGSEAQVAGGLGC